MDKSTESLIDAIKQIKLLCSDSYFKSSGLHHILKNLENKGVQAGFDSRKIEDRVILSQKLINMTGLTNLENVATTVSFNDNFTFTDEVGLNEADGAYKGYLSGLALLYDFMTTIQIGDQVWMATNLNVENFCNGDPIPEAKTDEEWEKAGRNKSPAWCYYNNDRRYGVCYGKLYNWYALKDPRGLIPEGWKSPDKEDWDGLFKFLDLNMDSVDTLSFDSFLKYGRHKPQSLAKRRCYAKAPGGLRYSNGPFANVGYYGFCWSSSDENSYFELHRYLGYYVGNSYRVSFDHGEGLSIRCLKI
jgi:uncharacterized protein (TIGR02145 family)